MPLVTVLQTTHEPLTNYNFKSYSADPRMGRTYNKILDDLPTLGHKEAWNLINILFLLRTTHSGGDGAFGPKDLTGFSYLLKSGLARPREKRTSI